MSTFRAGFLFFTGERSEWEVLGLGAFDLLARLRRPDLLLPRVPGRLRDLMGEVRSVGADAVDFDDFFFSPGPRPCFLSAPASWVDTAFARICAAAAVPSSATPASAMMLM